MKTIPMPIRLIICQMVAGFGLMLDPAYPTHGIGLAIMAFGAIGVYNNIVEAFSKKDSNDHPNN